MGEDLTQLNVLDAVKPELARQGHQPDGPHTAHPGAVAYLTLGDGRRIRARRDGNGYWQLLVYTPAGTAPLVSLYTLTSIADPGGQDFPGDPV